MLMRLWLEESGQWLENVDWIHLVLASGKPVLQKSFFASKFRVLRVKYFFDANVALSFGEKKLSLGPIPPWGVAMTSVARGGQK